MDASVGSFLARFVHRASLTAHRSRWSPPTDETRPDIKTSLRALSIEVTNNSQSLDLWQGADTHKREDMKVGIADM